MIFCVRKVNCNIISKREHLNYRLLLKGGESIIGRFLSTVSIDFKIKSCSPKSRLMIQLLDIFRHFRFQIRGNRSCSKNVTMTKSSVRRMKMDKEDKFLVQCTSRQCDNADIEFQMLEYIKEAMKVSQNCSEIKKNLIKPF